MLMGGACAKAYGWRDEGLVRDLSPEAGRFHFFLAALRMAGSQLRTAVRHRKPIRAMSL